MAKNFPHMNDSEFPHVDNVDVYKYLNEIDYSRFDYSQMKLTVCSVPWDMGEAHVGNRTISGIGNVVYFGSEENRNAWFDAIPDADCFRWETKFKELHRDNEIIVPLPYDVAARYNYVAVEYHLFANDDSLLEYENGTGVRHWFWFIREVEFVAPNSTKLHLLNDAWQTFIYNVDIPYMQLERGHAPAFQTTADNYLSSPIDNCANLLEPDADLGVSSGVHRAAANMSFDSGDAYVVFATTAYPTGTWGTAHSDNWTVDAAHSVINNGVPNYYLFAVQAQYYDDFCTAIDSQVPQFKQTVQAVFLVTSNLINLGTEFTFAGVKCWKVNATRKTSTLINLDKTQFGYDPQYSDLAKLYTYPYAYIEISDENGNATQIHIEETSGQIDISYCLNLAFPALNLNAYIMGIGKNGDAITFVNLDTKALSTFGNWYSAQWDWAIPTFAIFQEASTEYDYSGYFDRQQAKVDYDTTYDNVTATNLTQKENAHRSADAAKNNADDSADTEKTNTKRLTKAQKDNTKRLNDAASLKTGLTNDFLDTQYKKGKDKLDADYASDKSFIEASTNENIEGTAASALNNAANAIVGGAAVGAVSGGPAGAGIGAATGVISGVTGAVSSSIIISKVANMATISSNNAKEKRDHAVTQMRLMKEAQQSFNTDNWTKDSEAATDTTNNTVTAQNSNADDSNTTAKGNATRTQTAAKTNATDTKKTADDNALATKNAAISAVTNRTRQEGLKAPYVYGTATNGQSATTKPKSLSACVVTQSRAGIVYAGDQFLRYGYTLNRNWSFDGDWNIGRYFTYWKLSDFWVKGLNVPDMYMDKLRFFLFGGVTVWRRPEDIGHVSIYENGL